MSVQGHQEPSQFEDGYHQAYDLTGQDRTTRVIGVTAINKRTGQVTKAIEGRWPLTEILPVSVGGGPVVFPRVIVIEPGARVASRGDHYTPSGTTGNSSIAVQTELQPQDGGTTDRDTIFPADMGMINNILRSIGGNLCILGNDGRETPKEEAGAGVRGGGGVAWAPTEAGGAASIRTRIGDVWAPMTLGPSTSIEPGGSSGDTSIRQGTGGAGGAGGAGANGGGAGGNFQAGNQASQQAVNNLNQAIGSAQDAWKAVQAAQAAASKAGAKYASAAGDDNDPRSPSFNARVAWHLAEDDLSNAQEAYQKALAAAQTIASTLSYDPGTIEVGIQGQASRFGLVPDGQGGYTLGTADFGLLSDSEAQAASGTARLLNESTAADGSDIFTAFGDGGYSAGGLNIDVPTAFFGGGVNIPEYQKTELAAIFDQLSPLSGSPSAYNALLGVLKTRPDVLQSTQESVEVNENGMIPDRILQAAKAAGYDTGRGGAGGAGGSGGGVTATGLTITGVRTDALFGKYAGSGWPLAFDQPIGESAHDLIFSGQKWGAGYFVQVNGYWHCVVPLGTSVPPQRIADPQPPDGGRTTTPDPEPKPPIGPPPVGKARGGVGLTEPTDTGTGVAGLPRTPGDGELVGCDEDPGAGIEISPASFAKGVSYMGTVAAQTHYTAGKNALSDLIPRPAVYVASMDQRVRLGGGPFMPGAPLVPKGGIRLIDPMDINKTMDIFDVAGGLARKMNQVISILNERFPHGPNAVSTAGLKLPLNQHASKVRLDVLNTGTILSVRRTTDAGAHVAMPHQIALDPKTGLKALFPLGGDMFPQKEIGSGDIKEDLLFRFNTGLNQHQTKSRRPVMGWDHARKRLVTNMAGLETRGGLFAPTLMDPSDPTRAATISVAGVTKGANRAFTLGDFDHAFSKAGGAEGNVAVTSSTGKLDLSFIPSGSGSGLDADTLDGHDSSYFQVALPDAANIAYRDSGNTFTASADQVFNSSYFKIVDNPASPTKGVRLAVSPLSLGIQDFSFPSGISGYCEFEVSFHKNANSGYAGLDASSRLLAARFPILTGDMTTAGGSLATTLKNTGPGATGPLGSASVAPIVTIDAQGRITALTSATIAIPASQLTSAINLAAGGGGGVTGVLPVANGGTNRSSLGTNPKLMRWGTTQPEDSSVIDNSSGTSMRINSTNNIGIGTTNDDTALVQMFDTSTTDTYNALALKRVPTSGPHTGSVLSLLAGANLNDFASTASVASSGGSGGGYKVSFSGAGTGIGVSVDTTGTSGFPTPINVKAKTPTTGEIDGQIWDWNGFSTKIRALQIVYAGTSVSQVLAAVPIPAGSIILGVVATVTTAVKTAGGGAITYSVDDNGGTAGKFISTLTAGGTLGTTYGWNAQIATTLAASFAINANFTPRLLFSGTAGQGAMTVTFYYLKFA
jgi:hypothetical protein